MNYTLFSRWALLLNGVRSRQLTIIALLFTINSVSFSQNFTFNGTISRQVLNNYLERSGFMMGIDKSDYFNSSNCNTSQCMLSDAQMIKDLNIKMIIRAWDDWGQSSDPGFYNSGLTVKKMREAINNLDPVNKPGDEVIFSFDIAEYYGNAINNIEIPSWAASEFGYTVVPGEKFNLNLMDYNNLSTCGHSQWQGGIVPDISQIQTQIFIYYQAVMAIACGYECISFNDARLINDNDPGNKIFWSVLQKIRTYAKNGIKYPNSQNYIIAKEHLTGCPFTIELKPARRNVVLITAGMGFSPSNCENEPPFNDYPYTWDPVVKGFNYNPDTGIDNQLLFEFIHGTSAIEERVIASVPYKVINPQSLFYKNSSTETKYDRLAEIPANSLMLNAVFGGKTPDPAWNWTTTERASFPVSVHFDVGSSSQCEGEATTNGYNCPPSNSCGDTGNISYKIWGWDETSWLYFLTPEYRKYFLHYAIKRVKEINPSGNLILPLKSLASSAYFHKFGSNDCCRAIFMEANNTSSNSICDSSNPCPGFDNFPNDECFNLENTIINIINKNYLAPTTCNATKIFDDYSENFGYNSNNLFPRFVADLNNDGKKDMIAFGNSAIFISKQNSSTGIFGASQAWGNDLTKINGWDDAIHKRHVADINGDGRGDIIGYGHNGTYIGYNTGTAFQISQASSTLFGNTNAPGWNNTSQIRTYGEVMPSNAGRELVCFGTSNAYVAKVVLTNGNAALNLVSTSSYATLFAQSGLTLNLTTQDLFLKDMNNDGRDDIVYFLSNGVKIAFANGTGGWSTASTFLTSEFGSSSAMAWDKTKHVRCLGDVNGDNIMDIVGFHDEGVIIALSTYSNNIFTIAPGKYWLYNFGFLARAGGWDNVYGNQEYTRTVADINGDNKDDIVGFGYTGTLVSVSTGENLMPEILYPQFGYNAASGGWRKSENTRLFVDYDADGRDEIFGFGIDGVYTQNCNASGGFFLAGNGESNEANASEIRSQQPMEIQNRVVVFPNPSSGTINIVFDETSNQEGCAFSVYSFEGTLLKSMSRSNTQTGDSDLRFTLDLPKGIYIIKFSFTDGTVLNKKIVVAPQ